MFILSQAFDNCLNWWFSWLEIRQFLVPRQPPAPLPLVSLAMTTRGTRRTEKSFFWNRPMSESWSSTIILPGGQHMSFPRFCLVFLFVWPRRRTHLVLCLLSNTAAHLASSLPHFLDAYSHGFFFHEKIVKSWTGNTTVEIQDNWATHDNHVGSWTTSPHGKGSSLEGRHLQHRPVGLLGTMWHLGHL